MEILTPFVYFAPFSKKNIVLRFLNIILGIGLCVVLYIQLTKNQYNTLFYQNQIINPLPLFLCIVLMPVNWILEALKWKILIRPLVPITFYQSIKSVLSGVFLGVFTPARIGEYGGRMIHLPEEKRLGSIAATFYGSVVQNGIHVIVGLGLSYFIIKNTLVETTENLISLLILFFIILILFIIVLFLPSYWHLIFQKLTRYWFTKWIVHFDFLKNISAKTTGSILLLSGLRYSVYFSQYLLLLYALGINIPLWQQSSGISFIYLLQSGLPLPPILNFLGRGEISILVWGHFNIAAQLALWTTFLLWFINLVVPTIVGYFFVWHHNSSKKNEAV